MIKGVQIKKLRVIPDERGRLMEILREDDPCFKKFGQVYMTTTYPGVIKAWHYHKLQEDNITVVRGMLKVVLYDNREGSPTKGEVNEFFAGEHNPILIHVPVGVCHGWKCISEYEAIVINTVTEKYNYEKPDEYRLPYDSKEIPYQWDIKMG
ncbi:MAG: dTDP-4-dehydrorhamnose 3,5-epimerase family protein [candidate division KSB1 bacterium]|nr:dTDP-4-dehydrorhamnose 3,5-epimerase family protein [candidate division KSB1 bacterium]